MRLLRRAIELLVVVTMLATIATCGTATEGPSSEEPPSPTEAEPTNPPMPTPRPTETPLPTPTPALPTATPTPAGHAPVIVNLQAQSISDGERFARVDLDECVIDEDHKAQDIDWQISGNDELGLRTIGSHLLVSLPLPDWTGSETLLFEACDPDGLCASQEVEFTVRAENDAPQVTVGGQIIMPGESFVPIILDDWVVDEDNGPDEMTWAVVNKGELEVTVEAGVVTIGLPAEEWLGQEVVLFEACDPGGACGTKEAHFEAMARTEKEAQVTYIGNAGFMITVGDKKILIDAALRDPAVPGEVTTLIENAQPPFDDVDLILTSHTHFDHFTAETVLRHLEHNPAAIFVAGHDAVSAVNTLGDVRAQTVPLRLAQIAGERRQVVVNGIGLEALFLSHGGPILNLGFVVTVEGRRFFHTGDIDPDSVPVSELQGHGLPEKQIDVAFVAHFMLITPEQHAHVTKGIGAAHVVPMHYQYTIPPPDYDLMAGYFPQAVVLRESMATWVLPTPTLEPIDEPALAEEHSPAAGAVTGRIGDPDGSPTAGLNLFFENMANEAVTVVPLEPGTITYTTILSPGIYTAYTWAPDFGDKGAYSNCQPGEACSDRTLLPITVTAGLTVSEIDITDWFRPEGEPLALAGILVDGTGADPLPGAVVVIREERIVAVGPGAEVSIPDGAQVYDLPDSTLLPGFFNTHVHNTKQVSYLSSWAQAGVTTVREVGERAGLDYFATRDRLKDEPRYARILVAGPLVTVPEGYPIAGNNFPSMMVISPNDARQKIGRLIDRGADLIKITLESAAGPVLAPDTAAAIVETAHERGVPVTVHATRARDLKRALDAGVNDVCHSITDHLPDELLQRMIDMDVALVPTLEAQNGHGRSLANLRRFVEAGGRVALGNDAGYLAGLELGMPLREIQSMARAGMTPLQIIVAATRDAAIVCDREGSLGTLEVGKIADVLVVAGDPLSDLTALDEAQVVVHLGVVIRGQNLVD